MGKRLPKSWLKCYPVGLDVGKNQIIYNCHFKKYPSGVVARKLPHDVVGVSATVSWRNKRPRDLWRDDERVSTVGSRSSICWALLVIDGRRRQWQPTPVLLPGKSHGWRSLEGCSPWGHEESDTTERLPFHFSLSCIGEGNGNPLQSSCLENPRDGGAWWAAVYGVAQNRTRLEQLSSSSSSDRWTALAHLQKAGKPAQNLRKTAWRKCAGRDLFE